MSQQNIEPNLPEAIACIRRALKELIDVRNEEWFAEATSIEVDVAMMAAVEELEAALVLLDPQPVATETPRRQPSSAPTRQQGQFLAFIKVFMEHSYNGIAPTHAELQRYFGVTPPSVNSMLKRLGQLGFIERLPGVARAIRITIAPEGIPELERPFKFRP